MSAYLETRGELETYFDRTAVEAWTKLTSDAPVSGIRATVRAGRDETFNTLLGWLPADMSGMRLLDAGCGTGRLAVAAARRGADVVAIDLSPKLVAIAADRAPTELGSGSIDFRSGDMLDPALGGFDYVVSMDSLIHYRAADAVRALGQLAARASSGVLFTFAPGSPALNAMLAIGRLFPRGNRSPAIRPTAEKTMNRLIYRDPALAGWRIGRTKRVARGFYISQPMEVIRR